jgi:hypothetical protein
MLINVKCGSDEVVVTVKETATIAEVRESTSKHLGLEPDFQAWYKVDGERPVLISPDVEATTKVTNQCTVEFVKPSGQKG